MEYKISGGVLPILECKLNAGERLICDKGAMAYMDESITMDSSTGGSITGMLSRAISGGTVFQNIYQATEDNSEIAFTPKAPGVIIPLEITPQKTIIAQRSAFLASTANVESSTYLQRKLSTGFFGGEGFIMQHFTGQGLVFLEVDGSLVEKTLEPGQTLLVDTGNIAAIEDTVNLEIVSVKGLKNKIFGGEGFFNTRVTGPGKVWIQTLPLQTLASEIYPLLPIKD